MQHTQGISGHQLQMNSLEDKITADNPVRFIEVFVNYIDAVKLGFQCTSSNYISPLFADDLHLGFLCIMKSIIYYTF